MGELSNRFEQASAGGAEAQPSQSAEARGNDERIFSIGIGDNFDAAYASGRSTMGTPMIAIATPNYTVVYQPAAAEFGADSWIGNITYKNGDNYIVWPSGYASGGNEQAATDFSQAIDLLNRSGPIYVPPIANGTVSAGELADSAKAALAEEQAYLADLQARYPAARASLPVTP